MPPIVWLILIIGAVVAIASVCLFADPQERAVTQAAIIVVSGLVLVRFLDKPYQHTSGSIKPTAMTRALEQMERDHRERGQAVVRCADLTG